MLAVTTQGEYFWLGSAIVLAVIALLASFLYASWSTRKRSCISPYTGRPLRRASELSWITMELVLKYVFDSKDRNNKIFDIYSSAWCRQTGRIFPNCISWLDTMHVDWGFLAKRHPGRWVSWGSLTDEERIIVEARHESLMGYQTERSSPHADPSKVEEEFVYLKPGPLYVDLASSTLLGWQCVPETDLEVLIVQSSKI